jgi:general secretion pathway protein D
MPSQRTNSIIAPGFGEPQATNHPSGPAGTNAAATPSSVPPTRALPDANAVIPAGMIDFRGVPLDDVLKVYGDLVGRTILRPANLAAQQQIVLRTQTDLTKAEAVQALDAVLQMNGVAMINVGEKFVKAVLLQTAPQEGQSFSKLDPSQLPDMGQYTTHVVQLKYTKPSELVQALQPFAKAPNPILPIDSSQILVLRDFAENVKRMLELIKEIDVSVPSEYKSEVIPIKYALASDIASALNALGSGGGSTTVGSSSTGSRTGTSSFNRSGSSSYNRSGMGSYPNQMNNPMGMNTGMTSPTGTGSFSDRLNQIIRKASVSGDITVLGETKIIADERINALLVFATHEDMEMIKDVVSKLDVVLAQVLIEAVIIEVNLGDDRSLGVSYLPGPHQAGNFKGLGAVNNNNLLSPNDFVMGGGTNSSGSIRQGFSYLGSFGQDLDVSVTAVASDNRARILQRPRIQTSHAVPATLFVGESRPYPMGSYYGGGSYGSYSSIQQIQIGVTLDVTPLINPDGLVVMDIHQKIESANGSVNIANVGDVPVTSQKDAVAKVAVRDRDTIMLGGLIETTKSKTSSGVPYLKDIPLLGYLFRSASNRELRNELIVLIRPTVLPTPEIAALTAKSEKDKMPGVRSTERELEQDEIRRQKAQEREEAAERAKAKPSASVEKSKAKSAEADPRFAPVEGL